MDARNVQPYKKAFVSYSWDGTAHKRWVNTLAARLRSDGVDVCLDQWEMAYGDRLTQFMETSIKYNDIILIICTPEYARKSEGRAGGVGYEGDIITTDIFYGKNEKKLIPILRRGDRDTAIPSWLKSRLLIDMRKTAYDKNYKSLLDTILDRREKAPPLGAPPVQKPPGLQTFKARRADRAVIVVASHSGEPVKAHIILYKNVKKATGFSLQTDQYGRVKTPSLRAVQIERIQIWPEQGYWPFEEDNPILEPEKRFFVTRVEPSFPDCVKFYYGYAPDRAGKGVVVGVVGTGVETNRSDLTVSGGLNTVLDEDENDYGENGTGVTTHSAGIIAAHGDSFSTARGLAPQATLRSYRVFGKQSGAGSNWTIAKALDRAASDRCDLLLLDFSGASSDEVIDDALAHARSSGVLIIAPAGNDNSGSLTFPASSSRTIAVAALGRYGTYPDTFIDFSSPVKDRGARSFLAAFSNTGEGVSFIAPGVGVVSTGLGGYFVQSGTSVAAAVVAGVAALLLSAHPEILSAPRDEARVDAMLQLLRRAAQPLGFGKSREGYGLPLP
jgi:subtilisin family serine protease